MRVARSLAAALVALAAVSFEAPADSFCLGSTAKHAGEVIYTVGGWRDLFKFYKSYKSCDTDEVSYGLSDRVSDLLSRKWDTIGDLNELAEYSPAFLEYVLYHIDTLMRPDQAEKILDNAKNHCPAGAEVLCRKISAEVEKVQPRLWGTRH